MISSYEKHTFGGKLALEYFESREARDRAAAAWHRRSGHGDTGKLSTDFPQNLAGASSALTSRPGTRKIEKSAAALTVSIKQRQRVGRVSPLRGTADFRQQGAVDGRTRDCRFERAWGNYRSTARSNSTRIHMALSERLWPTYCWQPGR